MTELDHYTRFEVEGRTFGYLWEPTCTVGLSRPSPSSGRWSPSDPEVFEVQYTAYGYGWVVVRLEGVERDELAELVFEAWRLSARRALVDQRADRLPV